jgi:hypothetical protein
MAQTALSLAESLAANEQLLGLRPPYQSNPQQRMSDLVQYLLSRPPYPQKLTGIGLSVTTKGDLQGYDTAPDRVPVGTDGKFLTADPTSSLGVDYQFAGHYATLSSLGRTTSLTTTSLQHDSAVLPAGRYLICVNVAATSVGAVTLTGALSWTDPLAGASVAAAGTITLSGSGSAVSEIVATARTDGANNMFISVTLSGAGTVAFDVSVDIVRLG